ncbi:hypothetical protein SADUNF_Sadunf09G0034500 [Salix dunnii]|uniref:AAA+ ATPase domain-containing protein n=1 Tax=Salix dunnii TaxID=1413687 RepID=A0A835JV68_9ROSI|nr:hypothetical protein SADUNF_Sadunf09G0034500 [Salix dunnii]
MEDASQSYKPQTTVAQPQYKRGLNIRHGRLDHLFRPHGGPSKTCFKSSIMAVISEEISRSNGKFTPQKRRLRSNADLVIHESPVSFLRSGNHLGDGIEKLEKKCKSPVKKQMSNNFSEKLNWNPRDIKQTSAVKEALHLSTAPSSVVCREDEQKRVFDFCKACIEQNKFGSLYVCGCPGTGKSLSMEKVKQCLVDWAKEMMEKTLPRKKIDGSTSTSTTSPELVFAATAVIELKNDVRNFIGIANRLLIIADELDYLVTKECAVLYDLFMLTTLPFSRCILIAVKWNRDSKQV